MILLDTILHEAINPALAMLPTKMDTTEARVILLAIGLQESRFMYRYQKLMGRPYEKGPARSFWQMERGGGVLGVLTHHHTKFIAKEVCADRNVAADSSTAWNAIETDDVLAACFARLLLFTDPMRLPAVGNVAGAWEMYLSCWRPGKPHPETWGEFHAQARSQVLQ
jgi:hypothetical protein